MVTAAPARVPCIWPEATIVCAASGPSLTVEDLAYCRTRARVLVVKDAVRLAPWADALYACDARWWDRVYATLPPFDGPKYSLETNAARWATVLENTGDDGLEPEPTGLRTGKNSGHQAINLAVHFGARRIVLLGYDMQADAEARDHFFGSHPWRPQLPNDWYYTFRQKCETLVAPLAARGIEIVNATRRTALSAFPQRRLEEVLP